MRTDPPAAAAALLLFAEGVAQTGVASGAFKTIR
jgi:hypothetical protein